MAVLRGDLLAFASTFAFLTNYVSRSVGAANRFTCFLAPRRSAPERSV